MSLFSQKNLVPLSLFLFIFVTCPQLFSQPIAILTASQSQGLGPLTIDFDARDSFDPSGANLSYDWQFGDGAIGSGNQITHTYSNFGNYQCRLIVSNPSGQMDTSILAIQTFGAGNWIEWSDCPEKRVENGYVQAGDKFYLIGGLTIGGNFTNQLKMMAHDPLTDSWSYLGDMPYRFHHLQAVELDGLIYVVSSWIAPNPNNTSNDSIYIYDPLVDTWVSGREIPFSRKRGSAATVVHNGKIYVAGGNEGGHGVQGDVKNYFDVYDPRIGSFDSLPDLPHARDHVYGTVWGDKLYMAAGRNSGAPNFLDSTVAEVDVFDFNTASWSDLGSLLPTERSGAPVVSMDGKIIVIGGEVQDEQRALKTLEAYDLGTNQWINLQDLSTGMHATPGIVNNGSIYLAGGSEWRGAANKTNKTKVFISDGGNTPAPPILTPISAGNLTANTSEINFSSTLNGDSTTEVLYLRNKGGNQGIIIERFELNTSLSQISLLDSFTFPIVIPPNDSLGINIQYKAGPSNPVAGSIEVSRSDPYVDQSIPFGGFKPSPIFKYERQNNLTPLIFEFDATASYDNDGSIAEYEWDYGDGNMGQGSISTHTYTQNGIYAVKLIITDSQGLQDSLTRMLEVATIFHVSWIYIDQFVVKDDFVLNWGTSREVNNRGFGIEISPYEKESFMELAFVHGMGDSEINNHYSHRIGGLLPGKYVARIRQRDLDGTNVLSSNFAFQIAANEKFLRIFNQSTGKQQLDMEIKLSESQRLNLSLWDLQGRRIKNLYEGWTEKGSRRLQFDLRNMGGQLYLLKAELSDGRSAVELIQKQ